MTLPWIKLWSYIDPILKMMKQRIKEGNRKAIKTCLTYAENKELCQGFQIITAFHPHQIC